MSWIKTLQAVTNRDGKCTKCGALAAEGWAGCPRDGYCPAPTPNHWHWEAAKARKRNAGNTADPDRIRPEGPRAAQVSQPFRDDPQHPVPSGKEEK